MSPVTLLGDPILRKRCRPADVHQPEVKDVVARLQSTLYQVREELGFGRGIAAPQVGSDLRVVFIDLSHPLALINPRIISRSTCTFELWDDCLSLPPLLVRVRRHTRISVRYTDLDGEEMVIEAEGDLSELLQHEIDHLEGTLILDRAVNANSIYLREEWERQFGA